MAFNETKLSDRVLRAGRGLICAAALVMCVCAAHAQDPTPPKKKMKMDGVAVEKTQQKLEGVQKTVSGHVEVAGGKIYYEECGSGPVAVILLHDQWLHSVTWDEEWHPLCAKYHTIRYDRRGYGRSEAAKAAYSPADDLLAVINDRKAQRAVIVGSSTGAGVSLDFALAHPEMVEGLFLIGPVVDGMGVSTAFIERGEKNMEPLKTGDARAAAENWSKDRYIIGEGHEAARKRVYEVL